MGCSKVGLGEGGASIGRLNCHVRERLQNEIVSVKGRGGERTFREATLYRKDVWESMPQRKDKEARF